MKLVDVLALFVGIAMVLSMVAYGITSTRNVRTTPLYAPPPSYVSGTTLLTTLLNMLRSFANISSSVGYNVTQIIDIVSTNPIVQQYPALRKGLEIVNKTYILLKEAYEDYSVAQSYYQDGRYGLAIYYANESQSLANQSISLMRNLETMIPQLVNLLGPQGVNTTMVLLQRGLAAATGLVSLDRLIIDQASQYLGSHIAGSLSVEVEVPRQVALGQAVNVSGWVLINETKQAANALVLVGVNGGTLTTVEADPEGDFHAIIRPIFNASGVECFIIAPLPVGEYAGDPTLNTSVCVKLLYNLSRLTVNLTKVTVHPGQQITIFGTYSGAKGCSPSYVTVCVGRACWPVPLINGTYTYRFSAPQAAGSYQVFVFAPVAGSCSPSKAMTTLNVTPYPTRLYINAPTVWVGWLPLPISGFVTGPTSASPWDRVVLTLTSGNYTAIADARGKFSLYVETPVWGSVELTAFAYPFNLSLSPSSARARVYLIPGPLLLAAPLAIAAWGLQRGRKRRLSVLDVRTNRISDHHIEDHDVYAAWSALERAAGLTPAESAHMTARELASLSGKGEKAFRLASLIERAAYGPGLSQAEREYLRRLVEEVEQS